MAALITVEQSLASFSSWRKKNEWPRSSYCPQVGLSKTLDHHFSEEIGGGALCWNLLHSRDLWSHLRLLRWGVRNTSSAVTEIASLQWKDRVYLHRPWNIVVTFCWVLSHWCCKAVMDSIKTPRQYANSLKDCNNCVIGCELDFGKLKNINTKIKQTDAKN